MPLGAFKAALMGTAGVSTGDVVLIQSQTASDSATISFTSGINSTYGEYIFRFYNIHPEAGANFLFQANAAGASGYNETITSTLFRATHAEDNSSNALELNTGGSDQSQDQGTEFQQLCEGLGAENDESYSGELHLFDPSSTTYVKHFFSVGNEVDGRDDSRAYRATGYFNTTTAIDDVQFKMSTGNLNGTIKMWGVK